MSEKNWANQLDFIETPAFIARLKSGDEHCFEQVYQAYSSRIYNLAYRMLGTEADAVDTVQDTFSQVYRCIKTFNGDSRLYTWIFTIARNHCFSLYKKRKRISFIDLELLSANAAQPETVNNDPEKEQMVMQVKEGCLTGLIRCLSFYQRMAFILHVLLHVPEKEVAQIIDKSEKATRVLIHRARKNLKKYLCKNCSLYCAENHCYCENLIHFSLKQGWIQKEPLSTHNNDHFLADIVEDELDRFKEVVRYYQAIPLATEDPQIYQNLLEIVCKEDWQICHRKKV